MIEAIILNPPTKGGRRSKLSPAELEALAGWPNSRRRNNVGENPRGRPRTARGKAWLALVKRSGGDFRAAARRWRSTKKPGRRVAANIVTNDPGRKLRRRARRNVWAEAKSASATRAYAPRHAKAAVTGWKRRKKHLFGRRGAKASQTAQFPLYRGRWGVAANDPGRKRTRRNIVTNIVTNDPRRRRRGLRRNPFMDSFKQLFTVDTLIEGATVAGGALAAVAVPNLILNIGPLKNMKALDVVRSGPGNYIVSLLAAGAVSALAAYLGKPKLARGLLIGGVAGTITRVAMDVVVPKLPAQVAASLQAAGKSGLGGLGADVEKSVERAVEAELARQGISDYLTSQDMGDYFTAGEAQGAVLADLGADVDAVGEEGEVDPIFSEAGTSDL